MLTVHPGGRHQSYNWPGTSRSPETAPAKAVLTANHRLASLTQASFRHRKVSCPDGPIRLPWPFGPWYLSLSTGQQIFLE